MELDLLVLALTLYGEARGEPIEGIVAVASVIRNRAKRTHRSYESICREPKQFSCWNVDDPNYKILMEAIEYPSPMTKDKYYIQCEYIARGIIGEQILSNVSVAENYLTTKLYKEIQDTKPKHWANKLKVFDEIGKQTFLV